MAKLKRRKLLCNDCGVDVLKIGDWYMAEQKVWEKKLGLGWNDNLCFACLERRLGRRVKAWKDVLPIAQPLNAIAPKRLSTRWYELFSSPLTR
jgi:hypothetical protein